jgi:hypothetical protein
MYVVEKKLFKVVTDTLAYPFFYVEAADILEATRKATEITEFVNSDKTVGAVQSVVTPMLILEEQA